MDICCDILKSDVLCECECVSGSKFPLIITSLPSSVVKKCIVIEGGSGESKAKPALRKY